MPIDHTTRLTKHAGEWVQLVTDADYYCDHCHQLIAVCNEAGRREREAQGAWVQGSAYRFYPHCTEGTRA